MKKVRYTVVFLLLTTSFAAFSQEHEFGLWSGISNYFGSLNYRASFKYVRPGGGFFYRYNYKYRCAFRTSINYGMIEYFDHSNSDAYAQQRNLSVRSNIYDWTNMFEFNFFKYNKESKKDWFTPYIGIGFSVFFYNPQGLFNGTWYYLQPLGTEGQNDPSYSGVKKYNLYSFAIPLEGGFKFSFLRNWNAGIEFGLRETFTRYLDDASGVYPSYASLPGGSGGLANALSNKSGDNSVVVPGLQRGDGKPEQYLFAGITISYTIMRMQCPTTSGGHTYR